MKLMGGAKLKQKLHAIKSATARAPQLRVGFLEGAAYPAGDGGARLAAAAKRLTKAQQQAHPDWKRRLEAWARWQKANGGKRLSVAQVAFWDEYGTAHTKPRPFFRNMIASQEDTWGGKLAAALRDTGFSVDTSLNFLGDDIKGALLDSIESWPADNSDLTAFIKGFDKGLDDTGLMKSSIDYEIVEK